MPSDTPCTPPPPTGSKPRPDLDRISREVLPVWLDAAGFHVEAETLRQARPALLTLAVGRALGAVEHHNRRHDGQLHDASWVARRRRHISESSAAVAATWPSDAQGVYAAEARLLARECAFRAARFGTLQHAVATLTGSQVAA